MAQPVWTLSVDLQTRTATFQTGMAEAAKAARGSFGEIKDGARAMGAETGYSMTEARHGVMLLGEEFGAHLPRALSTFIASIGPVGAAMEAAFPFLAIIVGATLLIEHLSKIKEAEEKLIQDQSKLSTAVFNAFGALDAKLLEAEIKADELNNDHLSALRHQLDLINRQSMNELVRSFEEVAKAADAVFADLKVHWFEAGHGSEGAKHALQEFKAHYDNLLAQGKDTEASNLLAGTLKSAERILELQKQAQSNQTITGPSGTSQMGDYNKFVQAHNELQKLGLTFTKEEVEAQQALVDALQAQVGVQERVTTLKTLQESNTTRTAQRTMDTDAGKTAWAEAQAEKRAQEQADKEQQEAYRQAIERLQSNERLKIEATEQGSAERLAAIDAAIKEENSRGLQETGFYRSLLISRLQVARQVADEQSRLQAEAGKEQAGHTSKMGELQLAADKEAAQLRMSAHRVTVAERTAEAIKEAEADYKIKNEAFTQEIAALDKHGKDYENKLKALQDRQLELTRAHENQITQIKDKAEAERNARILAAEGRFDDEVSRGLANVIMRHESFGRMMVSIGDQVVAGMLQTAIKSLLTLDLSKEREAAAAARKAFLAGMDFPFPANIVMAPTLAAGAFAAVMAFEGGGIVPGAGVGDVVPAMLTPGESVLPKDLTDGLRSAARSGNLGNSGPPIHVHAHFAPQVQAFDSSGVDKVLTKHADAFHKHFVNHMRKMNQ